MAMESAPPVLPGCTPPASPVLQTLATPPTSPAPRGLHTLLVSVVPQRRWTAAILIVAGVAVFATVFGALPAAALVPTAAAWCVASIWFSLEGTSPVGFTVIASLVKAVTLFLIVWAIIEPDASIGIRNGLYWVPLGLLNMGTGLWFLRLIRHRAR